MFFSKLTQRHMQPRTQDLSLGKIFLSQRAGRNYPGLRGCDTCSLGFSSTYQQEKAESSENCCRVLYSAEHLFNRNHGWILIDICERL